MIQLIDTHRLPYKNAKLQAFALSDITRQINFYDYGDAENPVDIGTEVVTNERGYVFYGNGTQNVECLGVGEAAIVKVSLDGGANYDIQWTIHPDHDPKALSADDIFPLNYRDGNGNTQSYNPVVSEKTLPDYALKSEIAYGKWAESQLIVSSGDSSVTIDPWTKTITILADAPDMITVVGAPRAGQVIFIRSEKDCLLITSILTVTSRPVYAGTTYLLMRTRIGFGVMEAIDGIPKTKTVDVAMTDGGYSTARVADSFIEQLRVKCRTSSDISSYEIRLDVAIPTVFILVVDVAIPNLSGNCTIAVTNGDGMVPLTSVTVSDTGSHYYRYIVNQLDGVMTQLSALT